MVDQSLHPSQLVGEFIGSDGIPVWQVDRGYADLAERCLDVAGLLVILIAEQSGDQFFRRELREQGHPVIGALADCLDLIAQALDFEHREVLGRAFGFLEAQNVRLCILQEGKEMGQPCLDRINVPAGNLHDGIILQLSSGRVREYVRTQFGLRSVRDPLFDLPSLQARW